MITCGKRFRFLGFLYVERRNNKMYVRTYVLAYIDDNYYTIRIKLDGYFSDFFYNRIIFLTGTSTGSGNYFQTRFLSYAFSVPQLYQILKFFETDKSGDFYKGAKIKIIDWNWIPRPLVKILAGQS